MPRRAQKGVNPMIMVLTAIIMIIISVTVIFLLKSQKKSLRAVNQFNVNDYIKEGQHCLAMKGLSQVQLTKS